MTVEKKRTPPPDLTAEPRNRPAVSANSDSTIAPVTRPVAGSREPPGSGTMVGPYRLLRWLGSGGMGIVWEAVEVETGRRVALKCLSKTMLSDPQYVQRFIREAQLAARIDHPKVTFIFGAGEHKGVPYIAMELMPGTTLCDVVKAEGPMPVQRAVDAMIDIVEGLTAAHRIGLIHRDVKPSNCFLAADDSVKIGDFGLCKSMTNTEVSLTQTGTFMGTPSFSAPEQIRGGELDGRTDVYAIGATLFNLLTGRTPFLGDALNVTAQIVSDPPTPPRKINPDIPRDLEEVILKCLEKEPSRRFRDLEHLKIALVPFATHGTGLAHFGRRLAAFMTDYLLVQLAALLLAILFSGWSLMEAAREEGFDWIGQMIPRSMFWHTVFSWAGLISYFTFFEGRYGRALGKRLMGLKLVNAEGETPGYFRALSRSLAIPGLFGISAAAGIYYSLDMGSSTDAASMFLMLLNRLVILIIPLAILLATMRVSNRFRGLHGILSGTRVVRQQLDAATKMSVPVVQPTANTIQAMKFGPYVTNEMLGDTEWGTVYLGHDSALHRDVWVIASPEGSGPSVDRINLARAGRQRWLAGGQNETGRWDAIQAINGVPIQALVGICHPATWQQYRNLMLELARELKAAIGDGTLPPTLSLPQVWIDENFHLKLLDRRLVTLVENAESAALDSVPKRAPDFQAVSLLQETGDLIARTQLLPHSAREFLAELGDKPRNAATLAWAIDYLTENEDRLASLQWDTRAGVLGVTLGIESVVYNLLAVCFFLTSLYFIPGGFWGKCLAGLGFSLALPVIFGAWFRGGPVFRFMDINVCQCNGQLAGPLKCAFRSALAWTPVLTVTGLLIVFSMYRAEQGGAEEVEHPVTDALSNPNFVLMLFAILFAGLLFSALGFVFSIRSPNRGLQDHVAGTMLMPD